MPELTLDEAKKDLGKLVESKKQTSQNEKERSLSPDEKLALDSKRETERKAAEEAQKAKDVQAAKDKEILAKKEAELSAEEKKRKDDLSKDAEAQRKSEEEKLPTDEKVKRIQESTQKRIDEVVSDLKNTKAMSEKEIAALRDELSGLRKEKADLEAKINPPKDEDIITSEVEKEYVDTQYKYADADKEKPNEQRREMTQEEWDTWYAENPKAATAWEIRQETRRIEEKRKLITNKLSSKKADEFVAEVKKSSERTFIKHPELKGLSDRVDAMTKEGKSREEIIEAMKKDNPKAAVCIDVIKDNPQLMRYPNGPELVVAEMERRMDGKSKTPNEELKSALERIKALEEKLAEKSADDENRENLDEGLSSSNSRESGKEKKLSAMEQNLVDIMKERGSSQESIDSALKKHRQGNNSA